MSESEILEQLKQLQAQLNAKAPAPQTMMAPQNMAPSMTAMPMMGQQAMQQMPQPGLQGLQGLQAVGLLVAVSIPTPEGEATCHLQFGPEAAANPQAVIMQLMQGGWPVKIYRGSAGGYGRSGGFGQGGFRGGWGGSGGGGWKRGGW